jgi:bifunctional polynucleotide phosphatase/kinase
VGKYVPEKGDDEAPAKRRKVAAFDLVRSISTNVFGEKPLLM